MKKYFLKLYPLIAIGAGLALVVSLFSVTAFAVEAEEDTEPPTYVDNLVVVPGDGEVTLSWDAAIDDVGVVGYKVYIGTVSVEDAGNDYDMDPVEVGDVLESTVTGLENGVTYYFAMTALDAAGNESLSYSYEESATPEGSGDDDQNPTVVEAEVIDCTTVELTFSEEVALPEDAWDAFTIENLDNLLYLDVVDVYQSDDNAETIVLITESTEEDAQYLMTVGVAIEDLYGNAMISGTSDTAVFTGVVCVEDDVTTDDNTTDDTTTDDGPDEEAPALGDLTINSLTELELIFDEEVYLPSDEDLEDDIDPALEVFNIFDGDGSLVAVESIQYKETGEVDDNGDTVLDMTVLILTTEEHAPATEYYISVTGLMDENGNETEGDFTSATTYTTPAETDDDTTVVVEDDEIAPEDISELMSEVVDALINLSWAASVDSAGDLVDQMLYVSDDGGETYDDGTSIGTDATSYSYSGGVEGGTYTFKVITVDENGNTSEGALLTAELPVTGVGLGLLAAASLLGGGALSRRRKK